MVNGNRHIYSLYMQCLLLGYYIYLFVSQRYQICRQKIILDLHQHKHLQCQKIN